ncbi:MAG: DUF3426 domain-containing protein [Sulfuritalea sp.]|nr:DUF3426 domain-containing protein [Sulfuritalea sp.]
MLTRCPACATHFRVTPAQLKIRSGSVRCGECQHVFNALDTLIEEPIVMSVPMAAVAVSPAPTLEPGPQAFEELSALQPETQEASIPEAPEATESQAIEPVAPEPGAESGTEPLADAEQVVADADPTAETATETEDWSSTFPEPPPPPRRWPWLIGSVLALAAMGLQAVFVFRVELAVLWPETKPVLIALCDIADCEVGLPSKAELIGIEDSDLHPDNEHKGRLVLTTTLRNRAPFPQQFPYLELTLTDTADQTIARKVLAPADYLRPTTSVADGMQPNADIMVAIGVDSGEMAASGYRLYLFYP